jgi:conjugal transfer/entry exclusion protein
MTSQKVETHSAMGGLRDLSAYTPEQVAALPPTQSEAFTRLQAAQARVIALTAEHGETKKRIAECERLTDDLTRQFHADYPPITAIEAQRAVIEATRPKF